MSIEVYWYMCGLYIELSNCIENCVNELYTDISIDLCNTLTRAVKTKIQQKYLVNTLSRTGLSLHILRWSDVRRIYKY